MKGERCRSVENNETSSSRQGMPGSSSHGWQLQNLLAVFSYMNPILIYFFTSLCSRQLLSIAVPDAILPPAFMQSWIPAIPAGMTVYLRNLCITMTAPASH